ncbi:aldo/keto reductase [Companilactobacillus nantensis]|uniref:Oxidoreductase, aldo keto reductase family protein n=1 Tax=Companilactobacillus nantensis DSM 16982 TaxID=1423774 RepID=A0A0R1WKY6_9LACO|nr:aldo/keto reductase [Companilactobacillus nantensis]KRM18650.1 oxidoreductase, aldo keto reductase family protein [Companilactobacillus nantensis DSM 16982]GEO63161.1 oxidoreductase [Companilactobacillus nantensis]
MTNVPMVKLNNGIEMPQEGLGVLDAGNFDEVKQAVLDALETGYRMIDTAQAYYNEEAVGAVLKESGIDRSDVFVTTKVWISNYGYEAAKDSVEKSLKKLQTDYIDLVLLHQPYGDYYGAYRALEDLYEAGKIRAIGVANFMPDRYVDLVQFSKVTPAINQVETHIFNQQWSLRKYLDKYNTQLESWGPFAEGKNDFFKNETLKNIGLKYGKTGPQVALRYLTQNGVIIIPKSVHKDRMAENLNICDFELTDEDLKSVRALDNEETLFFSPHNPETVEMFAKFVKTGDFDFREDGE